MAIQDEEVEAFKLWADYVKHLTTLSTGSIVIIATFLEKLFVKPVAKGFVIAAVIGFLAATLSSIITFSSLVWHSAYWSNERRLASMVQENIQLFSVILALLGFCVGIVSLSVFVVKNML